MQAQANNKPSLKTRAINATFWSLGGQSLELLIRIGGNLILTRLLFPEAFGLMALITSIAFGLEQLSNLGIQEATISHQDGDKVDFLNTAWTVQVIRGVLMWLLACLLAWPIAYFYEEPLLWQLLPVVGLSALFRGLTSKSVFTVTRDMQLMRLALIDLISYALSVVIMVAIAWHYRSVWALALGTLCSPVLRCLLSYPMLADSRSWFRWDPKSAASIVDYGKWIFISGLVGYLGTNLDRLVIGKLLPMGGLGVYSIAVTLSALPLLLIVRLGTVVFQPLVSIIARDSAADIARRVEKIRGVILPVGLASSLGLVLFSPVFFVGLYDPRYWGAGWMAQLLAINVWFSSLQLIAGRLILGLGYSRPVAIAKFVILIVGGTSALVGCLNFGVTGLIFGMMIGTICSYFSLLYYLAQQQIFLLKSDFIYSVALIALSVIGSYIPQQMLADADDRTRNIVLLVVGLMTFIPIALFAIRRVIALWEPSKSVTGISG